MFVYSDKTYTLPYFNKEIEVQLCYGAYSNNNSLAVVLMCHSYDLDDCSLDDNSFDDSHFDEVFGTITVNLGLSQTLHFGEQFLDVNNYPQMEKWLMINNLAFPTGRMELSGRVLYPAYQFILSKRYIEKLTDLSASL